MDDRRSAGRKRRLLVDDYRSPADAARTLTTVEVLLAIAMDIAVVVVPAIVPFLG